MRVSTFLNEDSVALALLSAAPHPAIDGFVLEWLPLRWSYTLYPEFASG